MQTSLPSKEDFDNFLESNAIHNLFGGGDQDKICQVLNAVASIEKSGAFSSPTSSEGNSTSKSSDLYFTLSCY